MTHLVVERDSLMKMMEDWLQALGVQADDKVEVMILPSEVIIRLESKELKELDAWLDEATRKYDSVLRRLAAS